MKKIKLIELKEMTKIYETTRNLRRSSKKSYKSLLLAIPPEIRDIMKFEHGTQLKIEICLDENEEKYLKIRKIE